jgi:hypothetical protein
MAQSVQTTEVSIDWQRYDQEIRSLFVDQDKTLKFVKDHMERTYGLKAT